MLSPVSVIRRRLLPWSLMVGVLACAGLNALGAPLPKKDEPVKDEPKKDEPKARPALPRVPGFVFPNLGDAFKRLQPGAGPMQIEELRKQIEAIQKQNLKAFEELNHALEKGGIGGRGPLMAVPAPRGTKKGGNTMHEGRLGAMMEVPNPTLIDQLDLPKEQGMIVNDVLPESAAAKVGMKPHDILLELDGKPVSSKIEDFAKQVSEIKPNTPVDAVVMRKGRKETLKGMSLPESVAETGGQPIRKR